ncbi:MAG: YajD family HNH nuclease [Dehalococcoidia bacterium]
MKGEKKPDPLSVEKSIAELRARQRTYRERALKMFPWICARCGREFQGKRVSELTVHHIDHDHDNNPPDGSNWELLCLYCHENEHSPYLTKEWYEETRPGKEKKPQAAFKPLAKLDELLKKKEEE